MEDLKVTDIDAAKFDAFRKLFIPCNTHDEILSLCETHGGKPVTNDSTSNRMGYDFKNNVFLPDCRIIWNSRHFKGVEIILYMSNAWSPIKSRRKIVLKRAPHSVV